MTTAYDTPRPRTVSLRGVNVDTAEVTVAYGDDHVFSIDFGLFKELVEQGRLENYCRVHFDLGLYA